MPVRFLAARSQMGGHQVTGIVAPSVEKSAPGTGKDNVIFDVPVVIEFRLAAKKRKHREMTVSRNHLRTYNSWDIRSELRKIEKECIFSQFLGNSCSRLSDNFGLRAVDEVFFKFSISAENFRIKEMGEESDN